MSLLIRKAGQQHFGRVLNRQNDAQIFVLSNRKLNIVPSLYDGEQDPAPKFFSHNIQEILRRLTRPNFDKVFRKRSTREFPVLRDPKYKFLTDEELKTQIENTNKKARKLLQMPPVVKVLQPINDVLSHDPALIGYDTSKYLFTDISFGVANEKRIIVERDPDGTLRSCDHDTRKKLNQVYFPLNGRKLKEPLMFTDEEKLNSLLEKEQYEFVLDRACVQYEPNEHSYQRITSITYQHVDMRTNYDLLRSTRHFGPLTFYLTWHQSMDNLMLELLQSGVVREAVLLTALRQEIHGDVAHGDIARTLTQQILPTPVQLGKQERLTEEDITLDTKCVECIDKYIVSNSSMKSQQELALQGFREYYQQLVDLNRGVKKAHGNL